MDGPVELAYSMPFDGFATLVLEDEAGRRVRNLIGMARRGKGRQTERWDGLDETGKLVTPGTYYFRGLAHQGIVSPQQLDVAKAASEAADAATLAADATVKQAAAQVQQREAARSVAKTNLLTMSRARLVLREKFGRDEEDAAKFATRCLVENCFVETELTLAARTRHT